MTNLVKATETFTGKSRHRVNFIGKRVPQLEVHRKGPEDFVVRGGWPSGPIYETREVDEVVWRDATVLDLLNFEKYLKEVP